MARENQGLQIALIIFVMLTIILGVTTFLFFKQYQEKREEALAAQTEATTQKNTASNIQGDYNTLKEYLGIATTEKIDAISEQFRADMDKYAANLPEQERNYRNALRDQATTIEAKNQSLAAEQAASQQLQDKIEQLEDSKKPLVAQANQRAQAAEDGLMKAKSEYNDARAALTEQQKKQQKQHLEAQKAAEERITTLQAQVTEQIAAIGKLKMLLDDRTEKIEKLVEPSFETADGKVRWVNQRNGTVWINLGRADALQRLTSFSVYPADTNDVTKVGTKAKIEVTQILGDHLAEARILEDEVGDPVMPGDVIHTPVWAPGQREHFALTDGMDLDGNGKTDMQMVVNIITMNGGVVDCYIDENDPEFKRVGDITNETRYLVMGDAPDELAPEARRNARRDLLKDAEPRGLTTMKLEDLLERMGWKNVTPVVRFGRGANPNDFRAKPPEGVPRTSTGTVSPLFQPRRPPRGSGGSAY